MPVSGDIKTFSLAAISRMIHAEAKTGILKISSEGHVTQIYFSNGAVLAIEGDIAEAFSLEALLLADHLTTADNIQEARSIAQETGGSLGAILMERGFVSKQNLMRTRYSQFKEAAAKALTWQEGVFEYKDGLDGFCADIPMDIDPVRLWAEAEKWKEFRSIIPNDDVVFRIREGESRFDPASAEGGHRVMLMIDGERNVFEIMNETGLPRVAVYKALKNLFLQGVITRDRNRFDTESGKGFNKSATMQYFLRLLGEIVADLSMELGKKKADDILEHGIKATNHPDFFLQIIKLAESTETNMKRMNAWMIEQQQDIPSKELFLGFNRIVTFLLREEYHLLGLRSLRSTIQRVVEMSNNASREEQEIGVSVIGFLSRVLKDEQELTGTENRFSGLTTDGAANKTDFAAAPFPHLSRIGGATIIAFYSRIIQIIMDDLESAVGSKSNELLQKIVKASQYHEKFLCQFDVKDDVKTNVERIRQYISDKNQRLSKISFINGFQQVLIGLLMEKKLLLGDKPTQASLLKIEGLMPSLKQDEFKWLADHLVRTITSHRELNLRASQ